MTSAGTGSKADKSGDESHRHNGGGGNTSAKNQNIRLRLNLGFDRNDSSIVQADKLPLINNKGICIHYAVGHGYFAWKVRSEAGVIDASVKAYQAEELILSLEAVNFGFSTGKTSCSNTPWPHQDQDRTKPGFRCLQGRAKRQSTTLQSRQHVSNGLDDCGLIICMGAHKLSEEYHEVFKDEEPIPGWANGWYGSKETGMKWLADKGCDVSRYRLTRRPAALGLARASLQPVLQVS
ncbi:hypothetical protein LTR93_011893 [Exophiala xenobiotica]|nr:hypothetical protein LTR93_011893 [Exophiala xenobiotica]